MDMPGAALGVYSTIRYMALTTICIIILPATLWLLIQGEKLTILMAIATTLFIGSAIRATKILSLTLHRTFQLTHELSDARDFAEKLAHTDTLTELNNRRAFIGMSRQRILYCQRHKDPVPLLRLDLDHFKSINDRFGHDAGDSTLQQLARILTGSVRSSDICGRIGGEEFAVLLSKSTIQEASLVAEKIRIAVEQSTIKTASTQLSMTVSIGISSANDSLEALLKTADQAMYLAKQAGRNRVYPETGTQQPDSESIH